MDDEKVSKTHSRRLPETALKLNFETSTGERKKSSSSEYTYPSYLYRREEIRFLIEEHLAFAAGGGGISHTGGKTQIEASDVSPLGLIRFEGTRGGKRGGRATGVHSRDNAAATSSSLQSSTDAVGKEKEEAKQKKKYIANLIQRLRH